MPRLFENAAETIRTLSVKYADFAETHPYLAEYGLSALSITIQALVAGVPGLVNSIKSELFSRAAGAIAQDQINEFTQKQMGHVADQLKDTYPTMNDQDIKTLAAAAIIGPVILVFGAMGVKQILTDISRMAGKFSQGKFAFAGADGDIPSHHNHFEGDDVAGGGSKAAGHADSSTGKTVKRSEIEAKRLLEKDIANNLEIYKPKEYLLKKFKNLDQETLDFLENTEPKQLLADYPELRQQYMKKVWGLKEKVLEMRQARYEWEKISEEVSEMRRAIGEDFKSRTPKEFLDKVITPRNEAKYGGDHLGPTADYLKRIEQKSAKQMAESACRTGGDDIFKKGNLE